MEDFWCWILDSQASQAHHNKLTPMQALGFMLGMEPKTMAHLNTVGCEEVVQWIAPRLVLPESHAISVEVVWGFLVNEV